MLTCAILEEFIKRKDATTMNKPTNAAAEAIKASSKNKKTNNNLKTLCDKVCHVLIVTLCEATLAALAIQGMLSVVHTQKQLQIAISVGFVAALLIIRFRSK
jgi:hypothetical protein